MAPEQLQTRQTDASLDDDTDGDDGGSSKLNYGTDVWALGCMLYQFIYGHTPFAHISNMFAKMKAICDPKHDIEFAEFGSAVLSGSAEPWKVSPAAIDCIKRCLESKRPTGGRRYDNCYRTSFCRNKSVKLFKSINDNSDFHRR